jgi:WD40 repeat protein
VGWINCLSKLSNNKLASCSWDNTIKVWNITPTALNLLSTLTNHSERILKVIPLTNNRFGSCSDDKTVKIWNSENYALITSLQHEGSVYDILKLKQHEILVTSNYNTSIDVWDLKNYVKLNSLKGFYANPRGQKMIALPNGLIAISSVSTSSEYPIIIVDPINYTIVKQIIDQEYIPSYSSLCVLDKHSFIYAYEGNIIQISIDNDYLIVYGAAKENQLDGWNGLISVNGGEYLLVVNNSNTGFKGIKLCYKD